MRASHIPFVNSVQDAKLVALFYADSPMVRVSVDTKKSVIDALPEKMRIWVDPAVDAFHNGWPPNSASLRSVFEVIEGHEEMGSRDFQERPRAAVVQSFVYGLLDKCKESSPAWMSVPQLPVSRESNRNTLNKELARATGRWRTDRGFTGEFVLPVIITHDDQVHLKAKRVALLKQATACRDLASAEGFWVVHSGLDDQSGSQTNEKKRFPDLIAFHQELRKERLGSGFVVGGPYWGMNLVLWARGLIEYPAVGVGSGYQYFISGGTLMPGKTRVAIGLLRRQAVATNALTAWAEEAERAQPKGGRAAQEFEHLRKLVPQAMRTKESAKRQVAETYHGWIAKLEQAPDAGRALALYQDLSEAYVVGKALKKALPKDEKVTRPERIAQQLMMSCL